MHMPGYKFSKKDLKFIAEKKIPVERIQSQIAYFRNGFPPVDLVAAAIPGRGIECPSPEDIRQYASIYEEALNDLKIIKFVPASGAASRMFKSLFEFVNEPGPFDPEQHHAVDDFIRGLDKLALKSELQTLFADRGQDLESLVSGKQYREIVEAVLLEGGLNYGQLPKGLIRFHRYKDENRTPVEEHLVEGAAYCRNSQERVNLHFTVSDEHLDGFIDLLDQKQKIYEERAGARYQIDFSIQRSFTDTIAVDMENNPFRDEQGKLLFRPGGHGALLTNLNELDADLIFIKNIDNIAPDRLKPKTFLYKKALAGILLELREKIFSFLKSFEEKGEDRALMSEAEDFLQRGLNIQAPGDYSRAMDPGERLDYILTKLNRPIRVCGMVRNEGEPGGGPFWARNRDGSISLQVVETSQINFDDEGQKDIAASATHFNPVDLVCGIRDYQGNIFDLQRYTDPDTGFISVKSWDGRSLKAQELPGLWNGGMADWITLFVEVPIETFNPVKTINDLLRPQHIA
jgi:hypothetical protein